MYPAPRGNDTWSFPIPWAPAGQSHWPGVGQEPLIPYGPVESYSMLLLSLLWRSPLPQPRFPSATGQVYSVVPVHARSYTFASPAFLTSAFAPLSTTSQHAVHWYSRSLCLGTVFVRIVKFVSVRDCHGRSHTCKLGHVHFGSPAESFPAFSGYAVFLGQKYPSFAPTPQLPSFALLCCSSHF